LAPSGDDNSTGNVEALVGPAKHGAAFSANSRRNHSRSSSVVIIERIGDRLEITLGQLGSEGSVQPQMLRPSLCRVVNRSARSSRRRWIASHNTGVEIHPQEHLIE